MRTLPIVSAALVLATGFPLLASAASVSSDDAAIAAEDTKTPTLDVFVLKASGGA